MAKRKSNKSEAIRQYLAKHPDVSTHDVAKALNVTPALVYNVKSVLKAKRRRKKTVEMRKPSLSASTVAANGVVEQVVAAARLIQSCGGTEGARQALKAAEKVVAALENS